MTLQEMKEEIKADLSKMVGEQFEGKNGIIGVVLADYSTRGKPQAEFGCSVEGCTETHVRELSDWHQSDKCRTHAKSKAKGERTGTGLRSVKVVGQDGKVEVLREQKIDPTEPVEVQNLKRQINEVFEARYKEAQALKEQELEAAKLAREERLAVEKAARDAKKEADKVTDLAARLERAKLASLRSGHPVSPKLIAEAEAAGIQG